MDIPAVSTSNFDCALLSIRANVPDSTNCDGVAIVHHRSVDLWSANITVKDLSFPSPKNPHNNIQARQILARSMGNRGEIVSVERIILNLPSGIIYKWQVLVAPRNRPSPDCQPTRSVQIQSDVAKEHPLGKGEIHPADKSVSQDKVLGSRQTYLQGKETQAGGVKGQLMKQRRDTKQTHSKSSSAIKHHVPKQKFSHSIKSESAKEENSFIRTKIYYKKAPDVQNHNRFFSWLRRNFKDRLHCKKSPPQQQPFVTEEGPKTPAPRDPPATGAFTPIKFERPYSSVNFDYTVTEYKHTASMVRWNAGVVAALRYVTQCRHADISSSPYKTNILGKHQKVIAILADAGITTHDRDLLRYLLTYGKEKLNLSDSILDCYFIKASPVQRTDLDCNIYGVYCCGQ